MNDVHLEISPPFATIQVDGRLDLVRAYDLRHAVITAVRQGCRDISLDLTRVPTVDREGVDAVLWCAEHVDANGGRLSVDKLSGPLHDIAALSNIGQRSRHRECGQAEVRVGPV